MAIVNLTPDSFSDGGQFNQYDAAMTYIEAQIKAGADRIDIGAQSTRPGSKFVSTQEEIDRLTKVLKAYKSYFDQPLSLDTVNAKVAQFGIECGVDMINDVSGLTYDQNMLDVCAQGRVGVCLMHMKGTPQTMQENPRYIDTVQEVKIFLEKQVERCNAKGVGPIMIDPGIGFGKTLEHNLILIKQLRELKSLGCPILVGTSRKSFINDISPSLTDQRLGGTIASCVIAWQHGADVLRVHDVFAVKQALEVSVAIQEVVC